MIIIGDTSLDNNRDNNRVIIIGDTSLIIIGDTSLFLNFLKSKVPLCISKRFQNNQSDNASKSLGLMILTPLKFFSASRSASPVTR